MKKVENQMSVAAFLRNFLANLTHNGQKRFQILDGGDVSFFLRLLSEMRIFILELMSHCFSSDSLFAGCFC